MPPRILAEWDFADDADLAAPAVFQTVYRTLRVLRGDLFYGRYQRRAVFKK